MGQIRTSKRKRSIQVNFSSFAKGLFPFCSSGTDNSIQYFNELIGNFIKDGAIDNCPLLKLSNSMKQKIYNGERSISHKNALYLLNNIDKKKFIVWIGKQTDSANSWTDVQDWLKENIQNTENQTIYPDDTCTDLFEQLLRDIVSAPLKKKKCLKSTVPEQLPSRDLEYLDKFMKDFNEILKFCISTDLRNSPMPLELPAQFDILYEMWKYRDTDFKNVKLNSLKYDIINNLYDYFFYWGLLMSYDAVSGYCVYQKPCYPGSEKVKKSHEEKMIAFRNTFAHLHKNLCKFVIDSNLSSQQ